MNYLVGIQNSQSISCLSVRLIPMILILICRTPHKIGVNCKRLNMQIRIDRWRFVLYETNDESRREPENLKAATSKYAIHTVKNISDVVLQIIR